MQNKGTSVRDTRTGGTETKPRINIFDASASINDPPGAEDDLAETNEDKAVVIDVLNNTEGKDTDADGDTLSVSNDDLTQPANGKAEIISSGTDAGKILYTPNANYYNTTTPDTFTYKATDGNLKSNAATVRIEVSAVNDAPVAKEVSVSVANTASKLITLDASDVDGDSLTYKVTSLPTGGKLYKGNSTAEADEITSASLPLTLSANQVTYVPGANFNGSDSFDFKANDGTADSTEARVSINDTSAPTVSVDLDGQTGVSPTTNITVTFSEMMHETTLNDTTVKLVKQGRKPTSIPVTMTKSTDTTNGRTVLMLNPYGMTKQNLAGNTTYQLTIKGGSSGVKDLASNPLAQDNVSSFTTARK